MSNEKGKAKAHLSAGHKGKAIPQETEKTFIKGISYLGRLGGYPVAVDSKNGRIVRIRPLHYDWKYKPGDFNPWKIEARGKVFEAPTKTLPPPLTLAYKKRVYSPNRIKYPLKRVDWDPNGERNPQNRGKSKYKRISWDEAADIIASEIKRIKARYSPYAILHQGDGHGESKIVHSPHGCPMPLLALMGGFTKQVRNADSWEGWYWGARYMWGEGWAGMYDPVTNCAKDAAENTEMIIGAGYDGETTAFMLFGCLDSRLLYWWSELGIKQVYICPDLNYAAAVHADKWIPVLPNTDAAWQLAVAYVWMTEGTYDKDYIATHTYGFDRFKEYVLGKVDGVPKTPAWASPLCGIPEWTIKALAREWASKVTSTIHNNGGSYIRGPYAHEPARLEVALLAMQGLGKPGVHQLRLDLAYPPGIVLPNVADAGRGRAPLPKQHIAKPLIPKAILEASHEKPLSWYGTTMPYINMEDQFVKYTYPIPKKEGGSEIHMIWIDSPCWTVCWNHGNAMIDAFRSSQIECIVAQHQWLENDCLYADIILPVNTKLEENDIGVGGDFNVLFLERQAMEPIGESKSDYEAVIEVAKKLGLEKEYTGGKTVEEWIKYGYEISGAKGLVSWEELDEKQYYVVPTKPGWEKDPAGWFNFYKDPEGNPLKTKSGKLEFYSQWLAEKFPDDDERPPFPHWITEGETHQESLLSERAKKYPLLMISNHPRWRIHAQHDDCSWLREIPTCKVKGADGYMYEPVWIHPVDAAKRGIESGDIVKLYNERGAVLGGAMVWERIIPGAIYQDHGARLDEIIPGELDRGGSNNLIAPGNTTSRNCAGQATSGYLVEVEKVTLAQMEEWRKQYPDAFQREYDPASGLRFDAWIEKDV